MGNKINMILFKKEDKIVLNTKILKKKLNKIRKHSMSKKIVSFSLIGLSMFILSGCSSKEVTIENKQPVKYEVLGKAKGNGNGSLAALATAYYFIPLGLNDRTQRAYVDAISSVPGATGLINVTYSEDWFWWVLGTNRTVTITGDAIREIK